MNSISLTSDQSLSLIREVEAQVDANFTRAERMRQSILGQAFSGGLVIDQPQITGRAETRAAH